MGDTCDLRAAAGEAGEHCDGGECTFWRIAGPVAEGPGAGCAIKYYQLLGDEGVAAWLLSVKERLDRVVREDCVAAEKGRR